MLSKLYKAIWSRIGGRPWTDISRDLDKEWPLLFPLIFMGIGTLIALKFKEHWKWIVLAIIIGTVIGHIFWPG